MAIFGFHTNSCWVPFFEEILTDTNKTAVYWVTLTLSEEFFGSWLLIGVRLFARRTFTTPKIWTFPTPKFGHFPPPKKNICQEDNCHPQFFFFCFWRTFLGFFDLQQGGQQGWEGGGAWRGGHGAHQVGGAWHAGHGAHQVEGGGGKGHLDGSRGS